MIKKAFNIAAHVAVGAWSGLTINSPIYRHGGWAFLVTFLAYQGLGVYKKNDTGYLEVKEFMIGMGLALLARRFIKWRRLG